MEWKRIADPLATDPNGVSALLTEATLRLGRPLSGTRFIRSTERMLEASRQIETRALHGGGTLWVGVQGAPRLAAQAPLYQAILDAGTRVVAFGAGEPPAGLAVEWRPCSGDKADLTANWFLIHEPATAMVAFEGFRRPRHWEGFSTYDPEVVSSLVAYLEDSGAA